MSRRVTSIAEFTRTWVAGFTTLLVALMIGFEEIDRVGAQFPGVDGQVFSITRMIGPLSIANTSSWSIWDDTGAATPSLPLVAHVLWDLFFIATYVAFACLAIGRWYPAAPTRADAAFTATWPAPLRVLLLPVVLVAEAARLFDWAERAPERRKTQRARNRMIQWLVILVVIDLAEDILLCVAAAALPDPGRLSEFPAALGIAIGLVELVKFTAVGFFAFGLLRLRAFWRDLARAMRRAWKAIYAQRLSVVVVVVLVALALLPPWHELLEQLPDVVRAWFDDDFRDVAQFGLALVVLLAVWFVAQLVGRQRAQLYWDTHVNGNGGAGHPRRYGRPGPDDADSRAFWPGPLRYLLWWLPFTIVLVLAIVFVVTGHEYLIEPVSLSVYLVIAAGIPTISALLELRYAGRGQPVGRLIEHGRDSDRTFVLDVTRAGDILAALVVAVGALGFARSLGSPLIVALAKPSIDWPTVGVSASVVVLGIAAAVIVVSWSSRRPLRDDEPAAHATMIAEETDPRRPSRKLTPLGGTVTAIVAVVSIVFLAWAIFAPVSLGRTFGVVAVTVGVLGAITTLLALAVLFVRRRRPLALFEALHLRSDPVILLVIVVPFLVSQIAPVGSLHDVSRPETVATPERVPLDDAFDAWLDTMVGCAPDGQVPLVLVAAEGGGIRAAAWTTAILAQFARDGECAARSVFLSSGVSGGSVGLALAATSEPTLATDPDLPWNGAQYADGLLATLEGINSSTTLPTAVSGLIVTDTLAATTGLRLPNYLDGQQAWRDRAALIEDSWRSGAPELAAPWDGNLAAPTGYVVFNSTDVLTGCRVIVSQVKLGEGESGSTTDELPGPRCDEGSSEPALTLDLIKAYPEGCPFAADWATAALLSARFPVVTPGGTIDLATACPESDVDSRFQLVDGGYAENSGLGLLADIAPELGRIIAEHNADPGARPLVVPTLVYIENSPGAYLRAEPPGAVSEIAVPSVGLSTAKTQVSVATWIQRTLAGLGDPCADCGTASTRVVIAGISTEPSLVVPLGWSLSQQSLSQLFGEAQDQASANCMAPTWSTYSCLGSLLSDLPRSVTAPAD